MPQRHAVYRAAKEETVGLIEKRNADSQLQCLGDQDIRGKTFDGMYGEPVASRLGKHMQALRSDGSNGYVTLHVTQRKALKSLNTACCMVHDGDVCCSAGGVCMSEFNCRYVRDVCWLDLAFLDAVDAASLMMLCCTTNPCSINWVMGATDGDVNLWHCDGHLFSYQQVVYRQHS